MAVTAARLVVVAAALFALTAGSAAAAVGDATSAYVVRTAPGATAEAAREVRLLGGTVTRRMPTVDTLAARLPAGAVTALRTRRSVISLARDVRVRLQSDVYDAKSDVNSLYTISWLVGSRSLWGATASSPGYTGAGIDVAVIDSGVTPVPGLDLPGKIVHGPDISFDSQNPRLAHLDAFGHGTHVAGIIAGHDGGIVTKESIGSDASFLGVAPDARVVSVKVADAYGATDVSQVIAAIDWVVDHRRSDGLNIRVLNLSFGTASLQPYLIDPLCHAAEVAWRKGIVVVVAAGNDGTGTGKLLTPAQDPYVLAVGADDPRGTISTDDDVIPAFSSRGDGLRNPDLVAPGVSVQSLRVPGSFVDVRWGSGSGSINARFLRGSGTSQAAAVVSGAVAVLLEARPSLTPDDVKTVLTWTARRLPIADPQAQGYGILDLRRAVGAATGLPQSFPTANGAGWLDASRGTYRLVLNGVPLIGERDIFGQSYDAAAVAGDRERERAWSRGKWNGTVWTGTTWVGTTLAVATWTGSTWAGSTWAGSTWADGTWTGSTWAGSTWAGSTWAGSTWADSKWVGCTWAMAAWQ